MIYRLARFDLATEAMDLIEVETRYRAFIGGAGIAAALLHPELEKDLDPFDPQAPLLFSTGPLTGTKGPSVGRYVVSGKSPATGFWAESNIGGGAGAELRKAGFDGLWITGRANSPVYLWVTDGLIEMRSAKQYWGNTDTYETQDQIKNELGIPGVRVITIGLAGENRIPFAIILSDHGRVAGRTGLGAVMGAKNLKAIAIRGTQVIPLRYPDQFQQVRSRSNRELRDDLVSTGLRDFGTASASDVFDYFGMMPKKYFTKGSLPGTEKVSGPSMSETILSGISTCHGCVIACGRKVRLSDGDERKGPEYETIIGFGPNLGITDLEVITTLNERCDRLGMDTISLSNTLGLAVLLCQEGYIRREDLGGVGLAWGNATGIAELVEATAVRSGFGEKLALGSKGLAKDMGASEYSADVKGLEIPYHDPRGASGVGLVYATSPRGACHNQGHYYMVEIGQTIESIGIGLLNRQEIEGKAVNVARHQDWTSVLNSLVLCILANVPVSDTLELLNLATGWDYSLEELILAGERSWNLKRMINARLGVSKEDDRLPDHILKPLEDGGAKGIIPPIDELLMGYYQIRGWDPQTGVPTDRTSKRLGLREYA